MIKMIKMKTLEINNLTKIYKSRRQKPVKALNNFSLELKSGEVFGLIGPNGAGKTTLIKIILGMTKADSGEVKIFNTDFNQTKIKEKIGYLPENHKFLPYLTPVETLKYFSKLSNKYDISENEIDTMLSLVGLLQVKKKKIKTFSKGMMQRLGIAQALIHNPDFIMLDEPTDGVDPIGRKEIRNIISNLKNDGKTILINSHLLSEVEMICDEIGILNNGELIKKGKTSEFLQKSTSFSIEINQDSSEINLPSSEFDLSFLGKIVKLNTQSTEKLNEFIDWLRKNSIQIISISHEKYNLEDYFIKVIDGEENAK